MTLYSAMTANSSLPEPPDELPPVDPTAKVDVPQAKSDHEYLCRTVSDTLGAEFKEYVSTHLR